MKQCQKWWNEEQTEETAREFLAKHGGITTYEQLMDVLVEKVWRAALEMVKREIFEHKEALDIIEEELQDG